MHLLTFDPQSFSNPTDSFNAFLINLLKSKDPTGHYLEVMVHLYFQLIRLLALIKNEPWHEISNSVVCAASKASCQPAHTRSLIRAFACRLNIL